MNKQTSRLSPLMLDYIEKKVKNDTYKRLVVPICLVSIIFFLLGALTGIILERGGL